MLSSLTGLGRKPAPTWEEKAEAARTARDLKIPTAWFIPAVGTSVEVSSFVANDFLLTPRERELTSLPDATALLARLRSGEASAVEVLTAFGKRAVHATQLVNCLVDVDFEGALVRARELDELADRLRREGRADRLGRLHGLPVSFKDLTNVKGMKYSIGYAAWADRVAEEDAVTVAAMRKAGAMPFVKTTMPQTGMALETVSNLWGRTLNPANSRLSAGGSSGGEGALVACRGAPIGIGTDIRAPAAFNGLYGIRPTSRRASYAGNVVTVGGQIAIASAIGPIARSVRDLELVMEVWSDDEPWLKDPTVVPMPWVKVERPKKATIGVIWWDEVVMPHPPIQRALKFVVEKLRAAGHEVVDFKPYKHAYGWDITLPLYFPTGAKEHQDILAETGEPVIPAAGRLIKMSKQLSVPELMSYQSQQKQFEAEYLAHWNATSSITSSGKPIDAILAPCAGCASFPHDFLPWWGYFSTWNLLNYPSVILPVTTVDQTVDAKDETYTPVNAWDRENYEVYDPGLFHGAPVALQLVGRSLQEERLVALADVVDQAVRGVGGEAEI